MADENRLGCAWEVFAGMIPGEVMPEYSKMFPITGGHRTELQKFLEVRNAAYAYADYLQLLCMDGRACNWVRIEFTWL